MKRSTAKILRGNYPCWLDNCGCRIGHCDSKCREHNYVAENSFFGSCGICVPFPAVCGIVFRLSKIIKDGKNSPPGTDK